MLDNKDEFPVDALKEGRDIATVCSKFEFIILYFTTKIRQSDKKIILAKRSLKIVKNCFFLK
jgi:hypothetical protein